MRALVASLRFLVAAFSVAVFMFSAARWWRHTQMPFNSEGVYFDEAEGVVYSADGQLGWAVVAAASLGAATAATVLGRRRDRTR